MMTLKNHSDKIVRSNEIIGKGVMSYSDENLGKIEEIVLDKVSGNVKYVVLSLGGFFGIGDSLYAMPWNSLNYDKEKDEFRINIEKETLKSIPNFNKDHWPDFADPSFENTWSNFDY